MIEVLRNTTYARLFTAQVVALIGTGLLTVALGLLAYDLAGSDAGVVLGTALMIKVSAYVLVAPVVAALTEHLPHKVVLISADIVRAVAACALIVVSETWHIYVLIVVLQAASATFTPTFQALIPQVLPNEKQYTRALSLSRIAYDLEALLSPIFAAALLTVMSFHTLFAGTVIGFIGSAMLVAITPLPPRATATISPFMERLTRGVRLFGHSRELRGVLWVNVTVATATAMVLVNTVVIVQDTLNRSETDVALALAAYGTGSLCVALVIPRVVDVVSDLSVMAVGAGALSVSLAGVGAFLAFADAPAGFGVLLALWWVLGAATSVIVTPLARVLRRNSDESNRPAVFAAQFSLSHLCYVVTYPLAGVVGARYGLDAVAFVLAGIAVVASAGALVQWRGQRAVVVPR